MKTQIGATHTIGVFWRGTFRDIQVVDTLALTQDIAWIFMRSPKQALICLIRRVLTTHPMYL